METLPSIGLGTWGMAQRPERRADEIASLRTGLDLGMNLIDTAEMYGDGAAEDLVAEAIEGRRSEVFLVSKVLPANATRRGTIAACEASLRRLKTGQLDLYLLHWRGRVPLDQTLEAFDALVRDGKIRSWGVSNFDVDDMEELIKLAPPGPIAANQVLYNLMRRGIEFDLLPWCQSRETPIMAYSPLEQGRLLTNRTLRRVAERLTASPAQVALAWVLQQKGVVPIPKGGRVEHVRENRAALDLELGPEDLADLDRAFPPPQRKRPLEMI